MKFRECAICGNKNTSLLHSVNFELPSEIQLPSEYDIVRCPACDFVFADTKATQKDYDNFYTHHNGYESTESQYDVGRTSVTCKYIKENISLRASILEVGFSNGGLLKALKDSGYRVAGLDPSQSCVDALNKSGIKAYSGTLLNHSVDEKFDCIILSHVLEHIVDVRGSLQSIWHMLKDGGMVYIEVPNMMQYTEHSIVPLNYFDIEHINHFCRSSLTNACRMHGFAPVRHVIKELELGNGSRYPAIGFLCAKRGLTHEDGGGEYIGSYIKNSAEFSHPVIQRLIESQEKIVVWGVGSLTQRMFSMAGLGRCNIEMFVDNNKGKIGSTYDNKIVSAPSSIKSGSTVLILCVFYAEEIKKQIKDMGLDVNVITLGDTGAVK